MRVATNLCLWVLGGCERFVLGQMGTLFIFKIDLPLLSVLHVAIPKVIFVQCGDEEEVLIDDEQKEFRSGVDSLLY